MKSKNILLKKIDISGKFLVIFGIIGMLICFIGLPSYSILEFNKIDNSISLQMKFPYSKKIYIAKNSNINYAEYYYKSGRNACSSFQLVSLTNNVKPIKMEDYYAVWFDIDSLNNKVNLINKFFIDKNQDILKINLVNGINILCFLMSILFILGGFIERWSKVGCDTSHKNKR